MITRKCGIILIERSAGGLLSALEWSFSSDESTRGVQRCLEQLPQDVCAFRCRAFRAFSRSRSKIRSHTGKVAEVIIMAVDKNC